jgi:hypothetical protein
MVSPSVSDISLDPGSSIEQRITAVNRGDSTFNLQLDVAPYSVVNKLYEASFEPLPGRVPVQDWITLNTVDKTSLQQGKYYDVPFTVNVPASTPAGGYSAVIFVESTVDTEKTTGITARNRVAHIVYINVRGDVDTKGSVSLAALPFVSLSSQQSVGALALNEGGTNEKVKLVTRISDPFGRSVLSDTTERYVLPGTKRAVNTQWMSKGIFGIYKIERSYVFAGATSPHTVQWMLVIHPLFVVVASLLIIASVWLKYQKLRTMRARNVKT